MALSLKKCLGDMGDWKVRDLSLGLFVVHLQHEHLNVRDLLDGKDVTDVLMVQDLQCEMKCAPLLTCLAPLSSPARLSSPATPSQ